MTVNKEADRKCLTDIDEREFSCKNHYESQYTSRFRQEEIINI